MGILGVIIAILAVGSALFATFLFGPTGLILTGVLAVIAIALGIFKRAQSKKGGITAIVIAVLAIIMAFPINSTWTTMFKKVREKAMEYKPDGLWAQVSEDTSHGVMGIMNNIPTDDASLNALVEEMNELSRLADADQ